MNYRLTLNVFAGWLQTRINEHPDFPKFLVAEARQPEMPDRCVTIYKLDGGEDQLDGMFEEVPFRLVTRGREESVDDAQNFADLIDEIIDSQAKNTFMPVIVGGNQVSEVRVSDSWVVNKPRQIQEPDNISRYQFTADYRFLASKFNYEGEEDD